ncbi:unnamed protein product [Rotaria sp. Silwood1]|nr:unnamed protein product [Rotaria sp. Silwood1]CAF3470259.1 unnamed protein product [Rotaria sp. Silwood1]CAF3475695.1 unnamed protein product [Rotaria sp. Silwood1]CAF4536450.1 unnamed protein product [Rotaria sp. Silwood1]CAF4784795.1 unnamed protein product [Rotaria sp. Silwood1]
MDNHTSSSSPTSCFLFENTNGSIYPSDLSLTMIEDTSSPSSLNSSTNTNGSLSPSSSHQSLGISSSNQMSFPCCVFRCRPNSHPFQERCIPLNEQVKVGRAVARLKALPNNAIFDCKVLSRQHAKLWYENGKFLLQDTKSSNGTFVNNQRLGKCNEESLPFEIYSGDIIQFGVDVTENNRKTTHNCIIIEVKLYHSDGNEALPRSPIDRSLGQIKDVDINTQTLYQLAQYLQEAMHREQMLEQKLEYLQGVIRDTQQASNEGWQAIIDEDRLLARINALEDQIRIYHTKHPNEDAPTQEIVQLKQTHCKFENESKEKLEKAILERADAISRSKSLECSLQMAQDELKRFEEQNEQHKQEIQQLVQSLDEQRSLLAEFELKFRESQTRCTDLENERQRIQTEFENYYQRTHHLEELQQPSPISNNSDQINQNGLNNIETHGRFHVQSSLKDPLLNNEHTNNTDDIPIQTDNAEIEQINQSINSPEQHKNDEQRQTIIPVVQINSVINNNHNEEEDHSKVTSSDNIDEQSLSTVSSITNDASSIKDTNEEHNLELIEAQKQIELLREHLNETNDRLASMEDVHRNEQERYRSLTLEYDLIRDELVQLKQRSIKEKNDNNQLLEKQQVELDQLSKSIVSKQSEHDQLLSVYLCFFLSCYLLIFFLFFCLLSW